MSWRNSKKNYMFYFYRYRSNSRNWVLNYRTNKCNELTKLCLSIELILIKIEILKYYNIFIFDFNTRITHNYFDSLINK